jgi:hypothetical protein
MFKRKYAFHTVEDIQFRERHPQVIIFIVLAASLLQVPAGNLEVLGNASVPSHLTQSVIDTQIKSIPTSV